MDTGHPSGGGGTSDFFFRPVKILDDDENILYDIPEARAKTWFSNTQTLDLSRIEVLKNPLEIALPTDKDVYVYISVYDEEYGETDTFTRTMTKMWVRFGSIQVGTGWTKILYFSYDREAKLSFKYRLLECDVHFTGYGCNSCIEGWVGQFCNSCADYYYPEDRCTKYCKAVMWSCSRAVSWAKRPTHSSTTAFTGPSHAEEERFQRCRNAV